jgi:nucleoside-diphosphate-sugar epimerase
VLIHVTGALGLLGEQVTKTLASLGDVHGTDVGDMDITSYSSVMATFEARKPDVVVHLAALKGNAPSRERPRDFFDVNTTGTVNLLEACRQLEIRRFMFLSSLTVHGTSARAVDETQDNAPIHPYGGSKAAAEAMVKAFANAYDMEAAIFRPNFIVGPIPQPRPYVDNIIYDFIMDIDKTGAVELAGDGHYEREWLHPKDVASAIELAISRPVPGCEVYILSGNRVSMSDLAETVIRHVGRGTVKLNLERDGFSLISSSTKVRERLGWQPAIDLDALVAEIWDEYRARNAS